MDTTPAGALWVKLGWMEPPKAPTFEWHHVMPAKQATFSPEEFEKALAARAGRGQAGADRLLRGLVRGL